MNDAHESGWLPRLAELDACPWPGPRPLRANDDNLLVGRKEDCDSFRHEVDTHRLVLLAGVSGVGKTSLLDAGLQPALTRDGRFTVVVCREWGALTSHLGNASAFLASKVATAMRAIGVDDLPDDPSFFWALEQRFGERLVIILDQFEELIRFDQALKDSVCRLLLQINKRMSIKIVISLRSEYLHELRALENGARPFTLSRYILEDVKPEEALNVVLAPEAKGEDAPTKHIDRAAAVELAKQWLAAHSSSSASTSDPFGRIGLLHLQAALYSLHDAAGAGKVTVEVLEEFAKASEADGAANLFTFGVVRAIDVKLGRCRQAFKDEELDDFVLEGVQALLARAVPKLASGGYKLVRSARDLTDEVLSAELGVLLGSLGLARGTASSAPDGPLARGELEALQDAVLALSQDNGSALATDRTAELLARVAPTTGASWSWPSRLHQGAAMHLADPNEISCGPVMGLAPAAVLVEELRRVALMLAWLRATDLVRLTSSGGSDLMVSLIHDGFGEALKQWANGKVTRAPAAEALHALTAPFGAYFGWGRLDFFNDPTQFRVLANLRWRGNTVTAAFSRVVFVNCDFRGTLFERCAFEGVTFVNCRLDGTLFSDCSITGTLPPTEGNYSQQEPEFLVHAPYNTLLPAMEIYQGARAAAGPYLLAQHVGKPAVPAPSGAVVMSTVEPRPGGLSIIGGRLSALTIRDTAFREGGCLSFQHVAGSGLDLVEQDDGAVEVFGCALRHVTLTGVPAAAHVDAGVEPLTFALRVVGSAVAQAWVGDSVRGAAEFEDCTIVQFWNGSPVFEAKASADCRVISAFGLQVPADQGNDAFELRQLDDHATLVEMGRRMDYNRASTAAVDDKQGDA